MRNESELAYARVLRKTWHQFRKFCNTHLHFDSSTSIHHTAAQLGEYEAIQTADLLADLD